MFSEKIKRLRELYGYLQKDVASSIGITTSAYGFYEQGKRTPDVETLTKLAGFFDVSIDFLLDKSDYAGVVSLRNINLINQYFDECDSFFRDVVLKSMMEIDDRGINTFFSFHNIPFDYTKTLNINAWYYSLKNLDKLQVFYNLIKVSEMDNSIGLHCIFTGDETTLKKTSEARFIPSIYHDTFDNALFHSIYKLPVIENIEEFKFLIENCKNLIKNGGSIENFHYLYHVSDNSMLDFNICSEDFALIKLQSNIENGDTALICIDEDLLIRKVLYVNNQYLFYSPNKQIKVIGIEKEDLEKHNIILGKVLGIIHDIE
jgi:transcriptional regulator with XRE-family HTH domain